MPRGRPRKVVSPLTETEKDPEKNLIMEMIDEVDDSVVVTPDGTKRPKPTDPEWTDYVLSLLTPEEKDEVNSYPKTEGLKRLLEVVFPWKIIGSQSHIHCASPDFAAVEHFLELEDDDRLVCRYGGVGDAVPGPPPYDKHLTSIASTRALGRAIKDALKLGSISVAEEVSEELKITNGQKVGIKNLCKDLEINQNDLLKYVGEISGEVYHKVEDLTKTAATQLMQKLNKWNQNREQIPVEVMAEESKKKLLI